MLVFEEWGKPEYLEKNLSDQGREPTTNSTHLQCKTPSSGIEPGPQWWEVTALTTAPSLLPQLILILNILLFYMYTQFCYLQNSKPKTTDVQITTPTTENSNDKPKPPAKESISTISIASSMEICRICHCEAEPDQPLISPCLCAGSLQFVHQSCLQRWIKSSDTKKCELCKYEFIMESKMKPITKVSHAHHYYCEVISSFFPVY